MQIRQWAEDQSVDWVLLVREIERRCKADGSAYLRLTLADRTDQIQAMVWEQVERWAALLAPGEPVHVTGRCERHPRYGPQLRIADLRAPAPGSFAEEDLIDGPPRSPAQMEADLRGLLATIQDPHLRALLDRIFAPDSPTWRAFRAAPAAKHYHQAYRHGLLEHVLGVAQAVSAVSATFGGVDRDVALTGALLHDIGKLEAYETRGLAIDMSDSGRLQGEIPLGYYRVRRLIEEVDGFPAELAQAVLHIILSHHGSLEHGSPVVPCTREATLVHMIDNLGGRMGSFDRLQKELAEDASWSRFDRAVGASAFFGGPRALPEQQVEREAA